MKKILSGCVGLCIFLASNTLLCAAGKPQGGENEKGKEPETKIEAFLSKKGKSSLRTSKLLGI
jgi:hypothetical protein